MTLRRLQYDVLSMISTFRFGSASSADGLLKHLGQGLDGHLQILLVVLKDLRQVVPGQVEGKGVGPLQGLAAGLREPGRPS